MQEHIWSLSACDSGVCEISCSRRDERHLRGGGGPGMTRWEGSGKARVLMDDAFGWAVAMLRLPGKEDTWQQMSSPNLGIYLSPLGHIRFQLAQKERGKTEMFESPARHNKGWDWNTDRIDPLTGIRIQTLAQQPTHSIDHKGQFMAADGLI